MQTREHTAREFDRRAAEEDDSRGVAAAVRNIGTELGSLLSNTFRLFVCESQERVTTTVSLLMRLGLALGLGLIGLSYALAGLNELLVTALSPSVMDRQAAEWIVPLALGLITAIVGIILYGTGARRLERINIAPKKTVDSLKQNLEWARDWTKEDGS